MGVFIGKIYHGGVERVTGFFFLWFKIADGCTALDAAFGGDRTGCKQQCFGQAGLTNRAMTDQSNRTNGLRGVS